MAAFDIIVVGDPERARATAVAALEARKFRFVWNDAWTATAERGSKVANLLGGGFAQHFEMGVAILSGADPGQTVLRIERRGSGVTGGALGVHRTKKNFEQVRDELASIFQAAGVLVGVVDVP